MTNAEGCATLSDNPVACHNYWQCEWKANTGQTPNNYTEQIKSLGQQYSQYLEQQAVQCSKFRGLGTGEDACNTAKTRIADIKNTFLLTTNDLETDIDEIGKKIASVDVRINALEKENSVMEGRLEAAMNLDAGAQGMMTDAQHLYNQELVANWLIAIALMAFVGGMFLTKRVSVSGVKEQAKAITQQAARTIPGITSMIPGMRSQ